MKELAIGSVVKINIKGEIISCIVIGDFIEHYDPGYIINYLGFVGYDEIPSYVILSSIVHLTYCYKVLIGDQKVYVEILEMIE